MIVIIFNLELVNAHRMGGQRRVMALKRGSHGQCQDANYGNQEDQGKGGLEPQAHALPQTCVCSVAHVHACADAGVLVGSPPPSRHGALIMSLIFPCHTVVLSNARTNTLLRYSKMQRSFHRTYI